MKHRLLQSIAPCRTLSCMMEKLAVGAKMHGLFLALFLFLPGTWSSGRFRGVSDISMDTPLHNINYLLSNTPLVLLK